MTVEVASGGPAVATPRVVQVAVMHLYDSSPPRRVILDGVGDVIRTIAE